MTQARRRAAPAGPLGWARAAGGWARSPRVRRYLPVVAVLALSLVVVVGLAIVPARTWFKQRGEMVDAEAQLQELRGEVAHLDARLRELRTDEAVERIAREHYDLVFPGEESFRILPAPEP